MPMDQMKETPRSLEETRATIRKSLEEAPTSSFEELKNIPASEIVPEKRDLSKEELAFLRDSLPSEEGYKDDEGIIALVKRVAIKAAAEADKIYARAMAENGGVMTQKQIELTSRYERVVSGAGMNNCVTDAELNRDSSVKILRESAKNTISHAKQVIDSIKNMSPEALAGRYGDLVAVKSSLLSISLKNDEESSSIKETISALVAKIDSLIRKARSFEPEEKKANKKERNDLLVIFPKVIREEPSLLAA